MMLDVLQAHVPVYDADVSAEGPVACSCGHETEGVNEERWDDYVAHVAVLAGSPLDVPLSVDELAEVLPDVDPGLREDGEPEPWTARRAIVALHQALRVFQSVHDDDEPLVLRDAREAERESAEADVPLDHGDGLYDVADHPFQGTDGVPGWCTRCGCAPFIHPLRHKMSGDLVPLCGAESGEVCVNDLSVTCEGCLAIVRAAKR